MHLAALFGEQLHFLLDKREDQDLLVLVEHAVAALIKHVDELLRRSEPQHVVNVLPTLLENEADVRLVEQALLAEVRLLNRMPNLFALAGAADQRTSLRDQPVHLVARHVGQARESLLAEAASDVAIDSACVV